ncbi:MAG: hypothetical protein CL678_12480 [Bdellovibrionaceae bacterium]|nr:hypothetical protein [Pseudobdellovibrionaceae bacterium]|tara:strand:+ start:12816 stop:13592 length:777 start_codon:yes stop_codon:yes gene_type:complete
MIKPIKTIRVFFIIIQFIFESEINIIFSKITKKEPKNFLKKYSQKMIKTLNITINLHGMNTDAQSQQTLFVGNHLSYLDVVILSSIYETLFITSKKTENTFLLGKICKNAQCIFVDRQSRKKAKEEITNVSHRINSKKNITFFPEATSTNGDSILNFKRFFFKSAIQSKCKIQTFTLNYLEVNNLKITKENRDLIFWYGDMKFFSHFLKIISLNKIKVEVIFNNPINIKKLKTEENNSHFLSQHTRNQVIQNYHFIGN